MDFSGALKLIHNGKNVARTNWNGKNQFIFGVYNGTGRLIGKDGAINEFDKGPMKLVLLGPFIAIRTVTGVIIPWTASQADLLATDWEESTWVEPPPSTTEATPIS